MNAELTAAATRVAREVRAHREARGLSLSATAAAVSSAFMI